MESILLLLGGGCLGGCREDLTARQQMCEFSLLLSEE